MKNNYLVIFFCFFSGLIFAQDTFEGEWNGILKTQGVELRIVLNINQENDSFSATLDSPDQKVTGIPISELKLEENQISFQVPSIMASYEGKRADEKTIEGRFTQAGMTFDLDFSKDYVEKSGYKRPQEPKAPFPYEAEEVSFTNELENFDLAGTLTYPSKGEKFPAVVLISGSGAQDRNSEVMGHKLFLVVADYLTQNGIAVLRVDDRGTNESGGDFSKATTADFAQDVSAAVDFLKNHEKINAQKIGLYGHSEGGMIAPILATQRDDIAFYVLVAPPAAPIDELMLRQQELVYGEMDISDNEFAIMQDLNKGAYKIIKSKTDLNELKSALKDYFEQKLEEYPNLAKESGQSDEDFVASQVESSSSPWFSYFLRYDPTENLKQLKQPVLAVFGDKDLQVDAEQNAPIMEKILADKNDGSKVVTLEKHNHLMQECETGSIAEYAEIEQTTSPEFLTLVSKWITKQTK
ncbi:MAG: alpha/beta hydrolase family protein [Bacteroidota bacterium]